MISTGTARGVGLLWMWSPALATILAQVLFWETLRELAWPLGEAKYLLLGFVMPFVYGLATCGAAWATGRTLLG